MAKVQALRSSNGTKWAGYYGHRRIKVGEIFDMKNVDEEGFYVDEKGKRLNFDEKGKPAKEGKGEPRKCNWVGKVGTLKVAKVDPKEAAAVLSGKNPGQANPLASKEE